jgi:hypothetical protein
MKNIPAIINGRAIVITIDKKKVNADCGKLSDSTVYHIAKGLLDSVSTTKTN